MHDKNEIQASKSAPRGFGGPDKPGMKSVEKAKDFKTATTRLFKELRSFMLVIIIALLLAFLGAGLSIVAPNKLSKLTDEISLGLVVNKANIDELTNKIKTNIKSEETKNKISEILHIELSLENIEKINKNENISNEDKIKFKEILLNISEANSEESLKYLSQIPESIFKVLLVDSTYNEIDISVDDKIILIKTISKLYNYEISNLVIPESMINIVFSEIEIDNKKITPEEQYNFFKIANSINGLKDTNLIYSKINELPESIQKIIEPVMNMDKIKAITIILVVMYISSAIFTYIQAIIMTNVSNKFAKNLRSRISNKINKLPLKYFDRHQTGDILSRVTNDVDTIAQSMNQSLGTLVTSITLFLGSIIMMFVTNWIMAFTAILSSIIGFIGMTSILKKSQKYFVARQTELGNLNGHIEEIYSGLNVVKVYNGKKKADEEFDILNQKVSESNQKSQFLSGIMQPLMGFIGNFGYVAVCVVGALLAMNNKISFGVIVAFMTYVRLFTNPLSQMAQAMTALQTTAAASERVFEFIDEEEMGNQNNITKHLDKNKVKGKIEFKNVVFQYDNNDKPTINNFTATANPGQKIAIVGPTGAGKTTMVNLLMKFYNINSGDIKIDGVSTKELSRENIHDLFTMVLQDTWLFEGTIKENIIYNRSNISDERVEEVCKEVGLHHFIKTLPHGYNSKLSENDGISAGQRQLLTIARGMIEDSPFLILDEATSNVDTRTEELVQEAMDKLTKGKTSFIIAHRLSTIKNADIILVMKEGNIIEQGNHEELIAKNGFYADLYNAQFEL